MAEEKTMQTIIQVLEVLLEQAKMSDAVPADIIFKLVLTVLLMTKSFRRRKTRDQAVRYIAEEIEAHFRAAEEAFHQLSPEERKEVFKWPVK